MRAGLAASLRPRIRLLAAGAEHRLLTWSAARRDRRAGPADPGRLTAEERALLESLASLIVPGDDTVLDATAAGAVDVLERKLAVSAVHRGRYARGLPAYDALARRAHGRPFVALDLEQKLALLRRVDSASRAGAGRGLAKAAGLAAQALRVVRSPAAYLFPVLVRDVMEAYYSTPEAWRWLRYDGPPMPRGYLDVTRPRT